MRSTNDLVNAARARLRAELEKTAFVPMDQTGATQPPPGTDPAAAGGAPPGAAGAPPAVA